MDISRFYDSSREGNNVLCLVHGKTAVAGPNFGPGEAKAVSRNILKTPHWNKLRVTLPSLQINIP